jgi:hypothetical protein
MRRGELTLDQLAAWSRARPDECPVDGRVEGAILRDSAGTQLDGQPLLRSAVQDAEVPPWGSDHKSAKSNS